MKSSLVIIDTYPMQQTIQTVFESISLLVARGYLFSVFFFAGLTKLKDWESTLFLFEYEYAVPVLSPLFAAYLGTSVEIIAPVLLALGLFTPVTASALFVFNIVAVISLEEIAQAALLLHVIWGLLLAALIIWGSGKISVDQLIHRKQA